MPSTATASVGLQRSGGPKEASSAAKELAYHQSLLAFRFGSNPGVDMTVPPDGHDQPRAGDFAAKGGEGCAESGSDAIITSCTGKTALVVKVLGHPVIQTGV